MAEEIKNEVMSDEDLDGVAGGTRLETYDDGEELYKRGLLTEDQAYHSTPVRELLHKMGYGGYKDYGGIEKGNIYTDKKGNIITREQFWQNFDKENGTKIIR